MVAPVAVGQAPKGKVGKLTGLLFWVMQMGLSFGQSKGSAIPNTSHTAGCSARQHLHWSKSQGEGLVKDLCVRLGNHVWGSAQPLIPTSGKLEHHVAVDRE